jgi:hypothetical protein
VVVVVTKGVNQAMADGDLLVRGQVNCVKKFIEIAPLFIEII